MTGFPPPDDDVREFLMGAHTAKQSLERAHTLLVAIGQMVSEWLTTYWKENAMSPSMTAVAESFRTFMTKDMTLAGHNSGRKNMYQKAVKRAEKVNEHPLSMNCVLTQTHSYICLVQTQLLPPPRKFRAVPAIRHRVTLKTKARASLVRVSTAE